MNTSQAALNDVLKSKSGARLKLWTEICARCGLCAEACHFFISDPRPEYTPAYRMKPLLKVLKSGTIDAQTLEWLREVDFGTCTMCQRCSMYCPYGISIAFLVRAARSIAVSQQAVPPRLAESLQNHLEFGNNLAIPNDEFAETVEWQLEELEEEMPGARADIDRTGAETMLTVHPRDIKFYPENLYNYLKLYNAAGEDFTFPATGWDSTNVGLFSGDDPNAAKLAGAVVSSAERLKVKKVITAE